MKRLGGELYSLVEALLCLLIIISWIAGTVLAPGWLKLIAFFFPPYPWYLVVEKIMQSYGWV